MFRDLNVIPGLTEICNPETLKSSLYYFLGEWMLERHGISLIQNLLIYKENKRHFSNLPNRFVEKLY